MVDQKEIEASKLYEVSLGLSKEIQEQLGLRFPVKVFVQDPLVADRHGKIGGLGLEEIFLDWESGIMDGPTSARVAVVDYNADLDILAKPVEWHKEIKKFVGADDPKSFAFHQVNVWAIVQNTLSFFEDPFVMGRPIPWGFDGNRIIVVPHAGVRKNACYNRNGKCLQFYYFMFEGSPVYTCLSHDIVSHETGHAILDGIRPYYYEVCSVQTSAFHEFIADLTAILSALRLNSVRHAVAEISKGDIWNAKVIADLGEEFDAKGVKERYGDAQRYYLRTARNRKMMKDIKDSLECHDCSEVMTGSMFELLARITKLQMEKKRSPRDALWKATQQVNIMAFRALDFCPSVDVQFVDYARALLRADELAYPLDDSGYRETVKDIFLKRGVFESLNPKDLFPVKTPYSVELTWRYNLSSIASSRTAAYHFLNDNRDRLDIPAKQDFEIADLYYTDKVVAGYRKLPREIILEYVWKEDVLLKGDEFGRLQNRNFSILCGGTLVFDERGNILYWSKKEGPQEGEAQDIGGKRKERLLEYLKNLIAAGKISQISTEGFNDISFYEPPIICRQEGNAISLQMTPQFLHTGNILEDY